MKLCNILSRAFFSLWDIHDSGADRLANAEADIDVFEPMAPLRWTEESARGYHPSSSGPLDSPSGPDPQSVVDALIDDAIRRHPAAGHPKTDK